MNEQFKRWALEKFSGCDNGEVEAGSPSKPAIWLLGIEHGTYKSIHDENYQHNSADDSYAVETQMRWPYNQKAFKLLAAIHPRYSINEYKDFANQQMPFVRGSEGYFKGNIYPFPCHSEQSWAARAIAETGFSTKYEYLEWCHQFRLPAIATWVENHQPKVIIGVGIGQRNAFCRAVFAKPVTPVEKIILGGKKQRLFLFETNGRKLVVIPHFSGPWGLNSNALLEKTGQHIVDFLDGS